ncbi:MAG TPA: ATP synthase F0 subunit B [Planctomycetota bacterium]|nr:ATP synthase F0 subunit B [Planctomycetota bacterium]
MTLPLAAMGPGMMFLSQAFAFVILAALLWKLVIPVLGRMLRDRSQGIQAKFDDLARETREASEGLAAIQARLADIGTETKRRIDAAMAEGAKAREQAVAEAHAQAAAELAKAKRTIELERDKAMLELRSELARLTLETTERTIDSLMNEKLHGRIVDGYLDVVEKAARGR